jgi:hypothetical protein
MTFPTVKPSRPVYPPPVPVGVPVDPGGDDPATQAIRRQAQVADIYTRWREAHSPDIDPNVLKDNAGAFSVSDAALSLPDALAAVQADAAAAKGKVDDLIHGAGVDNTDVAGQISAQRFWARTQRTLDSIKDTPKLVAAAQGLIARADDAQIPCLSEELGDYLASRNAPTGWLDDAYAQRIPGLADAQADRIIKERQRDLLQHNHNVLTNAMAKDLAAPALLDPAAVSSEAYGE